MILILTLLLEKITFYMNVFDTISWFYVILFILICLLSWDDVDFHYFICKYYNII